MGAPNQRFARHQRDGVAPARVQSDAAAPALTRRELREREAASTTRTARTLRPAATSRAARAARRSERASVTGSSASGGRRALRTPAVAKAVVSSVSSIASESGTVRTRVASAKRRVLSNLASVGAMAGVALILVATTVPANAFVRPDEAAGAASGAHSRPQQFSVDEVQAQTVTRDQYTVVSGASRLQAQYGNQTFSFSNNPNGSIQWPFPTGVPITSGFGNRQVAGCGFCSTNHLGVDFTPGSGTPIQSIADGVVSLVQVSDVGLGNHVIVDHVVNGQKVQSVYAHMEYGSIKVATGQAVKVGQQLGAVGSTGASTGAHLHLEIHLDGIPVDPFAWLQANAK